jgi:hypothetical protein
MPKKKKTKKEERNKERKKGRKGITYTMPESSHSLFSIISVCLRFKLSN